jgi:Asp/Glu/hydantoin racemase
MKLIIIPPYQTAELKWHTVDRELLANLEARGQLRGVEAEIDEGYLIESPSGEGRDEEFLATITLGTIRKVKEYSALGKHDAIVILGVLSPGFSAARAVSRIPVTGQLHSSLHMASLVGRRFGIIHAAASSALILRNRCREYGFGDHVASVRYIGRSSTYLYRLIRAHDKAARRNVPEVQKLIDDTTSQCIAAITKERVDTLIISVEPLQVLEEEIRERLDAAGFAGVPIIGELSAGVETAKALVSAGLMPATRAYPSADLASPPEYW